MIIVDEAYHEASQRTARWAETLVRDRFRQVYGGSGDEVLDTMAARMTANIRSDNRHSCELKEKD